MDLVHHRRYRLGQGFRESTGATMLLLIVVLVSHSQAAQCVSVVVVVQTNETKKTMRITTTTTTTTTTHLCLLRFVASFHLPLPLHSTHIPHTFISPLLAISLQSHLSNCYRVYSLFSMLFSPCFSFLFLSLSRSLSLTLSSSCIVQYRNTHTTFVFGM